MPDQPVEDRGRPLGAPARRAREPAAPLTKSHASPPAPGEAPEGTSAVDLARARGKLFVVTGPSGAGKGTLIGRLVGRRPDLEVAVSATTRARRAGERDGRDYHFLSEDEFVERVGNGEFLEHVVYVSGHRYGTLRAEVERILGQGRSCVLELETEGARCVKELLPESVTVFVEPPSYAELERRLRERATESAGEIDERLELARRQMQERHGFDHVVVNDDVDRAIRELEALIDGELERCSAARTTAGRT